jgi:hypothetical protein
MPRFIIDTFNKPMVQVNDFSGFIVIKPVYEWVIDERNFL